MYLPPVFFLLKQIMHPLVDDESHEFTNIDAEAKHGKYMQFKIHAKGEQNAIWANKCQGHGTSADKDKSPEMQLVEMHNKIAHYEKASSTKKCEADMGFKGKCSLCKFVASDTKQKMHVIFKEEQKRQLRAKNIVIRGHYIYSP